jgi:hypothetical protein
VGSGFRRGRESKAVCHPKLAKDLLTNEQFAVTSNWRIGEKVLRKLRMTDIRMIDGI